MINIFTDSNYLKPENRKIIFPLLFDLHYKKGSELESYYQIVSKIGQADIVVVSIDINYFYKNKPLQNWVNNFIDEGLKISKPIWVYTAGDYGITLHKNVYTFRLSGYDSKLNQNTFILPSFINNPYEKLSKPFYKTQKKEKPLIGFVGNANGSLKKYVTELYFYILYTFKKLLNSIQTDSQKFYPSSIKRYYYLKKLSKSNKIETNFIFRKKYRAGIKSEAEKIKTTQEFFENLYNCPYTFCLRGAGNFSVRFYETIAMGRIPVIVKTDFRLPLNSLINWEKHCVLIEENNFIADFLQFHSNITPYDFEQMQINNLTLWKDILKRESYFITIASIFNK